MMMEKPQRKRESVCVERESTQRVKYGTIGKTDGVAQPTKRVSCHFFGFWAWA